MYQLISYLKGLNILGIVTFTQTYTARRFVLQ